MARREEPDPHGEERGLPASLDDASHHRANHEASGARGSPQIPRYLCCSSGSPINCSRAGPHRAAALDDVVAVGDAERSPTFLSITSTDWPAALQHRQAIPDFVADQGRETFGGLVQNQEARVGHQRPADRQHLLLAAGHVTPMLQERSASRGNRAWIFSMVQGSRAPGG